MKKMIYAGLLMSLISAFAQADEHQFAYGKSIVSFNETSLVEPVKIEITGKSAQLIYEQISWTDQNTNVKTRNNIQCSRYENKYRCVVGLSILTGEAYQVKYLYMFFPE